MLVFVLCDFQFVIVFEDADFFEQSLELLSVVGVRLRALGVLVFALYVVRNRPFGGFVIELYFLGVLVFALNVVRNRPFGGFAIELYLCFELLVLGLEYPELFFELFDDSLQSLGLFLIVLLFIYGLVPLSEILGRGFIGFGAVEHFDRRN